MNKEQQSSFNEFALTKDIKKTTGSLMLEDAVVFHFDLEDIDDKILKGISQRYKQLMCS